MCMPTDRPPKPSSVTYIGPRTPTPHGTRRSLRSVRIVGCMWVNPATGWRSSTTRPTATTSADGVHHRGADVPVARAALPRPRLRPGASPAAVLGASRGDDRRRRRGGYRRNLDPRIVDGAVDAVEPLISLDNPAVVVESVKLALDGSGDVVVRLYESRGGRAEPPCTATSVTGSRSSRTCWSVR